MVVREFMGGGEEEERMESSLRDPSHRLEGLFEKAVWILLNVNYNVTGPDTPPCSYFSSVYENANP